MLDLPCYALPCFASLCFRFALLCFNLLCCAMLCYALQCFDLLCYDLLSFDLPCYALLCLALPLLCSAVLCYAVLRYALPWLCYALLCFALLWFWGWSVSLSRMGCKMQEIHTIYAAISPQSQSYRKNVLFDPLCGGDHGRARKLKIYNKNITENHNEKSSDDFWRNLQEIHNFQWFSIKFDEKTLQK